MNNIKFEIINNEMLVIGDKSWEICDINVIRYVKLNTSTLLYPKFGVFIETNDNSDDLNYSTDNLTDAIKQYCRITHAIKKVNPYFKDYYPYTFNFKNVKVLDFTKVPFKKWMAKVDFGNKVYAFKTTEEEMSNLVEDNSKAKETNYNL